ncbi:MAG TPA: preprotein translocase subunit SecE [Terracidiphilus sp.]|nr:preprotein translocase subunit SecE [Terracidiphilus sp.]
MATKTAVERGEERSAKRQEPGALAEFGGGAMNKWNEFTGFLRDVRAEMRKVVSPSWKEVKATTGVVIVAVFLFGAYFALVDQVFNRGVRALLKSLGGLQ